MKSIFCALMVIFLSACGGTTFRNQLCIPSKKALSSDFNGFYSFTLGSRNSVAIPGFGYPDLSYIWIDVEKNQIRAVLPDVPLSMDQSQEFEGGFCKIDEQLYLQQFELEKNTWSIAKVNLEADGFTFQSMIFEPTKLAASGFDYIILDPDSYFREKLDSNYNEYTANIIVNNPSPTSDPSALSRILKTATLSSFQIKFSRVSFNDKIDLLFKKKGKSYRLGK